jgi:hypothetical protein
MSQMRNYRTSADGLANGVKSDPKATFKVGLVNGR